MKKLIFSLIALSSLSVYAGAKGPSFECKDLKGNMSYTFHVKYSAEVMADTATIWTSNEDEIKLEGKFNIDIYIEDDETMFAFTRGKDDLTFTIESKFGKELEGSVSNGDGKETKLSCILRNL